MDETDLNIPLIHNRFIHWSKNKIILPLYLPPKGEINPFTINDFISEIYSPPSNVD